MLLLEIPVKTIRDEIEQLEKKEKGVLANKEASRIAGAKLALEWILGKHDEHIEVGA